MKKMKSFVTITDCNQTCTACKFQALGFPYNEYNEYSDEHAVPRKDSRYALFDRFVGVSGNIERTATTKTQAFTENCIVCRSHRGDVGLEVGVVDVPEVLLA